MKITHYAGKRATIIEWLRYHLTRSRKPIKGSTYKKNRRGYHDCF